MRINERLNLVQTIDRADGSVAYVHSTPISRDVFDQHFLILTRTLTSMYAAGFAPGMCARMAARMLKQTATEMGVWDATQNTLMAEIKRLSNAVLPSSKGWETMPYEDAIARKAFDDDDVSVIENAIVFFTATSWVHTMRELRAEIYPMLSTSSSNSTEFAASLTISMPAAASGETLQSATQAVIITPGQPTRTLSVPS